METGWENRSEHYAEHAHNMELRRLLHLRKLQRESNGKEFLEQATLDYLDEYVKYYYG